MNEKMRVTPKEKAHTYRMGMVAGLLSAVEELEKVAKSAQGAPGFVLALATVRAEAESMRGSLVARNLKELAKAGVDIAAHKSVYFDPSTGELVCEMYDPDLFEGDQ